MARKRSFTFGVREGTLRRKTFKTNGSYFKLNCSRTELEQN